MPPSFGNIIDDNMHILDWNGTEPSKVNTIQFTETHRLFSVPRFPWLDETYLFSRISFSGGRIEKFLSNYN